MAASTLSKRAANLRQIECARLAKGPAGDLEPVTGIDFRSAHGGGLPSSIVEGWRDNHFAVWVSHEASAWGVVTHLWVRRHTSEARRPSWKEAQRIKDTIAGWDRVAVEVFPRRVDIVDQANMYHLWVLPVGVILPFGLGTPGDEAKALTFDETMPDRVRSSANEKDKANEQQDNRSTEQG
jgi:hypothetical protein